MHHLASLALFFFSRNIIALDAFLKFPKIFVSKGLKGAMYKISLHTRHLLSQASCTFECMRKYIYIHLCKCDGNDIILLTCNLHFKAPCSKTGSVSPSLSVTLTLTHIFTNTHKGHKLFLRSESPQFPQTALEMVQQERLPKLIIAGQLIRLLQPPSVPCTHGVDRGAESGLSL